MRTVSTLVILFLTAAFTFVAIDSLRQGEDALIQRQYAAAIPHLQKALVESKPEDKDRILLLLARAQVLAGDAGAGVKTYERLVQENPSATLARKARFQAAEALAGQKNFREAAAIYRDEIERLVGLSRKEEIAATYLGLAEQALSTEPRDFARAVQFFDLAVDLGLSPEKERSVKLLAAEARLKEGNFGDAIVRFAPLTKSLTPAQGQLRALLGLGQAKRNANDRAGARAALRDLIALSKDAPEAGDASYEIALTYGVPAPQPAELDRAVTSLEELVRSYPTHPKAKIAMFLAAQCFQNVGRSEQALVALHAFVQQSAAESLPEVPLARAMIGDVLFSQNKLGDAIAAYGAYLKAHPAHQDWERAQRAIVDAEYGLAQAALAKGKEGFAQARELFDAFARAYPLDARNPEILRVLGEMLAQEEKHEESKEAFQRCVSKYPGTEASSHAQFRVGEIFEHKTFNYLEALRAYRKVTWGNWAAQAQARIALLEKKHLHLVTKRTFRSGEAASFELVSRNIEKPRVRVYRLDLETYFRATHAIDGVQRLDIEVIEPDKTFESTVKDYKQYQQTEREIEIGGKEPGAYVVKVDDKELEATTMVLVTDVAMITKSSRHELLVFTENQKENRIEGGVKVVVSDGGKVITEGVTGADGCFSWKGKELQTGNELRVFAVAASGSGASSLDLNGLGYAPGLTAKGYLFTERPAYQPGQLVHVKGIVREVKDGLYDMPRQEGYRVQVFSAGGRLIVQRAVQFTDFGTFAIDVPLPPDAELGEWRIAVDRGAAHGESFASAFTVARYERPRVMLVATPDAAVVFRGEKIAGKLVAKYFFGEPVVGRTIAYALQLPDGGRVEKEAQTNAGGEVPFSFETKEFGEEALAIIDARLVEENAMTRLAVPVVTTEFTPALKLVRPVYLAGESFDVAIELADRAGKPLAKPGVARLLRLETRLGRATEIEVAQKEFTTGAKDGKTTVAFSATKGGSHLVRIEAKDRFGTLVTGQIGVEISGEDDQIKLRLLGDRQSYKVGEKALVKVMNRAGDRLVLQTLQGDGVLEKKAFVLKSGESTLELVLEPMHSPNLALALAMVDGDQLRLAERELLVARDLSVTVASKRAIARPGEQIEIEVEARDPKGAPVVAEVALALVDEALLSVYADRTPAIGAFFYGKMRETAFRTTSSCTWRYEGKAQRVSAEIVAEERRAEQVAEKAAEMARRFKAEGVDELQSDGDARANLRKRPGAPPAADKGPSTPGPSGPVTGALGGEGAKFGARRPGRAHTEGKSKAANEPAESDEGFAAFFVGGAGGGVYRNVDDQAQLRFGYVKDFGIEGVTLAPDQPRVDFSETGAWLSSVVTGADGKARVQVKLPDSTTSFRIQVRGATRDTYVGEASTSVRTQKDLQAGILAPVALTEGDKTTLSLRAHNLTDQEQEVALTLKTKARGNEHVSESRVPAKPRAEIESGVELAATSADDITLELAARAGAASDALVRTLAVAPFGIELRDGASGTTTERELVNLSLPQAREYVRLSLEVWLGADPGMDLVTLALGTGYMPRHSAQLETTTLALASRGIAALLALQHVEATSRATPAEISKLRGLAEAVLGQLASTQLPDGSFAWIGKQSADPRSTAQVLAFASACKKRGMASAEDLVNKSAEWLLKQRSQDTPGRARTALALALAGRARFEDLNALHRARMGLDLASLSRLGLAWLAADRRDLAREVTGPIEQKLALTGAPDAARIEAVALATAMLLGNDPKDANGARGIEWLKKQRRGASFGSPEATAAALSAFVAAGGTANAGASRAEVTVTVNGKTLVTLPANAHQTQTAFAVPVEGIKEQGNTIEIRVSGPGLVHWSAVLSGFAKGFRDEDRRRDLARLERVYLPAFLRHENKPLSPGFSVVAGQHQHFENTIQTLETGKSGRVRTWIYLEESQRAAMTPMVVEEPIPAGCTVPRDSIQGSFDHVEVLPDRLVLYYREGKYSESVQYELQARFPGQYRVLPTRVYGALRPDLLAHGASGALEVTPRGTPSRDAYRLTPDERYNLGKALFDKPQRSDAELEEAGKHLEALLKEWKLRDEYQKEVSRMMLFVSVQRNDAAAIVRFFEDLKDRYADLVIPFDKIVAVGKAYLDQGEFERALMVFRAAAEASFLKEAAVATTLEGLGEVKAGIRFLRRLLSVYPDLNVIRAALYGLAQKEAQIAAQMPEGAPLNEKVGKREELRHSALRSLREFLVLYPEDSLAEEVSFAWATTHLEAKDPQAALEVAQKALLRYPNSTFEDELLYTVGYCLFANGKHEDAFATLARVSTEMFPRPDNTRAESENKYHAIYLQGQIHHALGVPEKALACYEQVKDRFSDAGEATDYFLRKALALPEVTTVPLADKPEITISYRNVKQAQIKVYRVDLMRLYLLEKSLNDIRGIELHGISPYATMDVELGEGRDYRTKEKKQPLELKDPGAYLVVVRGGDLLATGMVLRSDLKIEAQESFDVGRVRVNVKKGDAFLAGAHAKVVGSGDQKFQSGDTDLRGILAVDGLVGQATVIVKKGDEYAFYRGSGIHQPQLCVPVQNTPQHRVAPQSSEKALKQFDALDNNINANGQNRGRQLLWLQQEVYNKKQTGVEVGRTK